MMGITEQKTHAPFASEQDQIDHYLEVASVLVLAACIFTWGLITLGTDLYDALMGKTVPHLGREVFLFSVVLVLVVAAICVIITLIRKVMAIDRQIKAKENSSS